VEKKQEDEWESFNTMIQLTSKKIAEAIIEDSPPTPLQPNGLNKVILQKDIEKIIQTYFIKIGRGAELLVEEVIRQAEIDNYAIPDPFFTHLVAALNKMSTLQNDIEGYYKQLQDGKSFYEIVGLGNDDLDTLYRAAEGIYIQKRFEDCSACLTLLAMLEPKEFAFWLGLGNCEYFQQRYETALIGYGLAMDTNPNDLLPYLYSSKCYEALNDQENAIDMLKYALEILDKEEEAQEDERYTQISERKRLLEESKRKEGK